MSTTKSLFDDFNSVSKEEWIEKVTNDLKGKDFQETMTWNSEEGFEVEAMYMESDMDKVKWVQKFENQLYNPEKSHIQSRYWQNCSIIAIDHAKEAQKYALEALQSGAEAVLFQQSKTPDFPTLLEEVLLPYCGVFFSGTMDVNSAVGGYLSYAASKGYDLSKLEGGFLIEGNTQSIAAAIKTSASAKGVKVVGIEAEGKTISQRIASVLKAVAQQVESLEAEGISPKEVFENLHIRTDVSSSYFPEIAGLRALRILLTQMASLYRVEMQAYQFSIHAFTTLDNAEEDVYQFMLSNTTQAMSAIIGGANVVTVLPHTFQTEKDSRFSLRIARNVSTILKEEGYLDKVADPSAGSYYIETLTAKLAEKAWDLFRA